MDLEIRDHNGIKIVELAGELDSTSSPEVYEAVRQRLGDKDSVIVNMTDVNYMSSAGIRTLLLLYRSIAEAGGQVVLVGLSEFLQETLDVTGFLEYFNTQADLDAGLKAIT
jgi:anti-sigma B factor antagonist